MAVLLPRGAFLMEDRPIFTQETAEPLGVSPPKAVDSFLIEIQAYCAIIACLLISLWTGRKPTLRTYEMICLYFGGWATLEELIEHIQRLKPASA